MQKYKHKRDVCTERTRTNCEDVCKHPTEGTRIGAYQIAIYGEVGMLFVPTTMYNNCY